MAVKLRLKRIWGLKKHIHRIVAADSRSPRDGKFIEPIRNLINPTKEPAQVTINEEVALKWLNNGAQPSDTVKNLLSQAGIIKKFTEAKQGK